MQSRSCPRRECTTAGAELMLCSFLTSALQGEREIWRRDGLNQEGARTHGTHRVGVWWVPQPVWALWRTALHAKLHVSAGNRTPDHQFLDESFDHTKQTRRFKSKKQNMTSYSPNLAYYVTGYVWQELTLRRLMSYIYIYIYIWSTHSWCF